MEIVAYTVKAGRSGIRVDGTGCASRCMARPLVYRRCEREGMPKHRRNSDVSRKASTVCGSAAHGKAGHIRRRRWPPYREPEDLHDPDLIARRRNPSGRVYEAGMPIFAQQESMYSLLCVQSNQWEAAIWQICQKCPRRSRRRSAR